MRSIPTAAGNLAVGSRDEVFRQALAIAGRVWSGNFGKPLFWALSGGSTPVEWYRWCVAGGAINNSLLGVTEWFVSDERHVPLASGDSNFGVADRHLLQPLGVEASRKHPWPVEMPARECAAHFEREFRAMRPGGCFDVCFLGLGGDGHTASLFPGGPLVQGEAETFFAAVEVPGKGWRLTITPRGLRACGSVVVMALGAGKREAIARVLAGEGSLDETPARLLREMRDKVTWLVDDAAVERIEGL